MDADGVALLAIQALYQMAATLERKTAELEARGHALDQVSRRVRALEQLVDPRE